MNREDSINSPPGRDEAMSLSEDIRRVVTTLDKSGKAVVLFDGPNPHKKVRPQRKTVSRLVWVTDGAPADMSGRTDRAAVDIGIVPPPGGSVFRVIDVPPTPPEVDMLDVSYQQ